MINFNVAFGAANAAALAACNVVHALDALGLRAKGLVKSTDLLAAEFAELDTTVEAMAEGLTHKAHFFATQLHDKEEYIKSLPIDRLDERQGLLVDLLVTIVDHETEHGELTAKAGNEALESMEWWSTLGTYASSCGFKRLGNGHFSAAYSHPMLPGKIIKVGFKKEDSGAAYVAFCRMHQGRVGIPTIYDVQRHASCYTVVMDHLQCAEKATLEYDSEAYTQYYIAHDGVESGHLSDTKKADMYTQRELDLAETAKEINKFFKGIARFDMHRGNVMLDRDGNVVITDPVSFSHDRKATEFQIDPEQLLIEIEAAAQAAMVARCKARKAKRSPTAIEGRKVMMKLRKAGNRARKQRDLEFKRERALDVDWDHAKLIVSRPVWAEMCWKNKATRLDMIARNIIDKDINEVQARILKGRNTLPMDERLDKQFLKG